MRQCSPPAGRSCTTVARAPRQRVCAPVCELVLWVGADQPVWAKPGEAARSWASRRFTSPPGQLLADSARCWLLVSPPAPAMSRPTDQAWGSIETTADLLEEKAGVMAAKVT